MMVRSIASSEVNTSIHPAFTLSILVACVAATIAIVATLCVSHHRKSPSPKPRSPLHPQPSSPASNKSLEKPELVETAMHEEQGWQQYSSTSEEEIKVVVEVTHGPIEPVAVPVAVPVVTTSGSRRKLSMSLSMKLPDGLPKIRTSRKERQEKATPEGESLCMKTIILGERCKVPSEEDEVVVIDENGNRQRNYHPRTPRSMPASRTNSFTKTEVPAA